MGRSMQWLLQRCSRHINCSSDALYDWVRCLEDIYFDGGCCEIRACGGFGGVVVRMEVCGYVSLIKGLNFPFGC